MKLKIAFPDAIERFERQFKKEQKKNPKLTKEHFIACLIQSGLEVYENE
ncbi:MAG: hypothetical protein GY861_14620 [bacterium]|nr:hypothetical protein [bacterium]